MDAERTPVGMDIIEDNDFSLDGYQVVREEFFAQTYEPSITLVDYKVYVNTACIRMLSEYDYIQILVNPEVKKLAVRPCSPSDKDSLRWCSATAKRSPRHMSCRIFFAKVFTLMGWDTKDRYKMMGKLIKSKNKLIFVFDLTSPKVTIRDIDDEGKIMSSRYPSYPADWQNQFGLPVEEHDGQLLINIFDDKAVFSLEKDPLGARKKEKKKGSEQESEGSGRDKLSITGSGSKAGADDRPEEEQTQDI